MTERNAKFEVSVDLGKRTLFTRMTGLFSEADMTAWAETYRRDGTDRFKGRPHMVLADMRGMKTVHPSIAAILGAEIGHARQNGVVLCAHLSDDTVQRLQAKRVARANVEGDDVTVDVASVEEAHRVIDEARARLEEPSYAGASVRAAV